MEQQQTEPGILKRLAFLLGTEVKNRRLEIPEKFGKGYCAGFIFNEHIRMLIMNYELNEDLVVKNPDIKVATKMILFKFQHIFSETETVSKEQPSVLITTSSMNTDAAISVHTNT